MRIVIDASRTTVAARTGTENYALQLIRALLDRHPSHQIILCFRDKPRPGLFKTYTNVQHRVLPFPRLWTHGRFASALYALHPDVTFVPAHTLPLIFPGRSVVTIHDVGYRFFPEAHPPAEREYLDRTTHYSARRATRILADSQATRRDLMAQYDIQSDKIEVVYPGVEGLRRASDPEIASVGASYHLPRRYFLFLGTLQPRKNIQRLLDAFARFVTLSDSANTDIGLVLAGKRGWLMDDLSIPETIKTRVRLTGYIKDTEVAALYSGALALVFPSLYEGFGFPVLEAMQCGTPVLCSNTSSLPELAGDAALLVDPLSVGSIADGMTKLAGDAALRADLVRRGYPQAAAFTWQRAAELTLHALEMAGQSR